MKLTLESTTKTVEINGVPARVWEGHTDTGIPVHVYITRVAVNEESDRSQFEHELESCRAPSPAVEAIDMRLIL